MLQLVHERLKFMGELPQLTEFFFSEPTLSEEVFTMNKQLKKLESEERTKMLTQARTILEASGFTQIDLETRLRDLVEKLGTKPGILFGLLRAVITGSNVAPGLFETMQVLGKDKTIGRISAYLATQK